MLDSILTVAALCHALAARLWALTAPAPVALLLPAPDPAALTVAELRRLAARRGHPRRLYTYGRRAELLAALA